MSKDSVISSNLVSEFSELNKIEEDQDPNADPDNLSPLKSLKNSNQSSKNTSPSILKRMSTCPGTLPIGIQPNPQNLLHQNLQPASNSSSNSHKNASKIIEISPILENDNDSLPPTTSSSKILKHVKIDGNLPTIMFPNTSTPNSNSTPLGESFCHNDTSHSQYQDRRHSHATPTEEKNTFHSKTQRETSDKNYKKTEIHETEKSSSKELLGGEIKIDLFGHKFQRSKQYQMPTGHKLSS